MQVRQILHLAISALFAAGLTATLLRADSSWQSARVVANSLSWARQISSQAEGLALHARMRGEADPVDWAVNFLAQGVEPRIMKITRQTFGEPTNGDEVTRADFEKRTFEYSKIFSREDGAGVRIRIQFDLPGFLGTASKLASDFAMVACFLLFWIATLFTTLRWWRVEQEATVVVEPAPTTVNDPFRDRVAAWAGEAKTLLTRLGASVRDLIREAQTIAIAAGKSRALVEALRSRVHANLSGASQARKGLNDLDHLTRLAEVLTLNLRVAAEKAGAGNEVTGTGDELHRVIQRLRSVARTAQDGILEVERSLEPLATDADLAVQAYSEVFAATARLDGQIEKTKDSLIGQARQMQGFSGELAASKRGR